LLPVVVILSLIGQTVPSASSESAESASTIKLMSITG
jgi:hypothetical protein